ncbi:hypothetical protein [Mucilaginibacter gossypiicola]|uniref:hypothetical protein n=1 Tax=Mucilaginibacter gossypiicola TaxID=551995 RepID=UPI00115FC49B|nr:hypothetical protein [Mucilaginibacter gossypiicola]
MLRDELKILRDLTNTVLEQTHLRTVKLPEVPEKQQAIATEIRRIKTAWSVLFTSTVKDYVLKRYVNYQQAVLVDLADRLFAHIVADSRHGDGPQVSPAFAIDQALLQGLLELLAFLEQYFEAGFNRAGKIPDALIQDTLKEIRGQADAIVRLLESSDTEESLKQCLIDYLELIPQESYRSKLNFHTRLYIKDLLVFLTPVYRRGTDADRSLVIVDVLMYLNFNFYGFVTWLQEQINYKIRRLATAEERLLVLIEELVRVKTSPVMLSVSCDLSLPPLAELLEAWLNEAIKKESGRYFPRGPGDSEKKLGLSLSVTQLSLFIRLLYEEGFFTLKNITAILRFTAKHFTTKRQEHISAVNMGRTYYGTDQFTAAAVKDLLLRMLARLNRMFFPLIALTIILWTS